MATGKTFKITSNQSCKVVSYMYTEGVGCKTGCHIRLFFIVFEVLFIFISIIYSLFCCDYRLTWTHPPPIPSGMRAASTGGGWGVWGIIYYKAHVVRDISLFCNVSFKCCGEGWVGTICSFLS